MKFVSTVLLAAGLAALAACGGAAENTAANNVAEEIYNVAPDDLGGENALGNDALDAVDANASAENAASGNVAANSQ